MKKYSRSNLAWEALSDSAKFKFFFLACILTVFLVVTYPVADLIEIILVSAAVSLLVYTILPALKILVGDGTYGARLEKEKELLLQEQILYKSLVRISYELNQEDNESFEIIKKSKLFIGSVFDIWMIIDSCHLIDGLDKLKNEWSQRKVLVTKLQKRVVIFDLKIEQIEKEIEWLKTELDKIAFRKRLISSFE